eukprot:464918-Pleurochrysis_carterae.AAC.3
MDEVLLLPNLLEVDGAGPSPPPLTSSTANPVSATPRSHIFRTAVIECVVSLDQLRTVMHTGSQHGKRFATPAAHAIPAQTVARQAAMQGNYSEIRRMLAKGVSVNAGTYDQVARPALGRSRARLPRRIARARAPVGVSVRTASRSVVRRVLRRIRGNFLPVTLAAP